MHEWRASRLSSKRQQQTCRLTASSSNSRLMAVTVCPSPMAAAATRSRLKWWPLCGTGCCLVSDATCTASQPASKAVTLGIHAAARRFCNGPATGLPNAPSTLAPGVFAAPPACHAPEASCPHTTLQACLSITMRRSRSHCLRHGRCWWRMGSSTPAAPCRRA